MKIVQIFSYLRISQNIESQSYLETEMQTEWGHNRYAYPSTPRRDFQFIHSLVVVQSQMNTKPEYLLAVDSELASKRRKFGDIRKVKMQRDLTQ